MFAFKNVPKRFDSFKVCSDKNSNGQTAQKLRKGQKPLKNTENRLKLIFRTKYQKECVYKQKFVYKDRIKMLPIIQNSLTNDQNGRTAQKLLRG